MPLLMNLSGPTGAAATGPTGDPGATVTGPTGDPGATVTGPTGIRGTQWYNGSGAPTAGIGEVGDYYVDSANGDLYVRDATGW